MSNEHLKQICVLGASKLKQLPFLLCIGNYFCSNFISIQISWTSVEIWKKAPFLITWSTWFEQWTKRRSTFKFPKCYFFMEFSCDDSVVYCLSWNLLSFNANVSQLSCPMLSPLHFWLVNGYFLGVKQNDKCKSLFPFGDDKGVKIALILTSRKVFNCEYLLLQWLIYFSLSTKDMEV
jgi:hypothetical protein